jgi:hypothetical protein
MAMNTRALAVALIGAGAMLAQSPASAAEAGVKVGTLTCSVAGGWGMIVTSRRRLACIFNPSHYRAERYYGVITKIGVDIGYRRSGTMVWAVFAPTDRLGHGDLRGSYGGVTASATIGVGLGANALIGGSNHTFALQPVSIEGSTGLNVAAGIGGIDLHYARNGPRSWRHHYHHRHG